MRQLFGTSAGPSRTLSTHVLDYAIPTAILLAVLVVLAPVPPALVDLLLAANLTVSVLALLGALAARTPLEMSIFPTFLLGSTLVRLVLNIATTRLILSRAASLDRMISALANRWTIRSGGGSIPPKDAPRLGSQGP